ncbi:hypothetical protein JMUB3933_1899 [Leptotrichia wadei]|uniref:Uncharacterized protein n=1 Tax=Leptotrichia wadei TaxID=157687 RepID=A0A510KEQ9_9FUSO|nr:hypothetical protein JMUB3933_1899 [Leptotrichia wadei]
MAEYNYAYYCLHKLKIRPSEFAEMDIYEKGFIMACIDLKLKREKEAEKDLREKLVAEDVRR